MSASIFYLFLSHPRISKQPKQQSVRVKPERAALLSNSPSTLFPKTAHRNPRSACTRVTFRPIRSRDLLPTLSLHNQRKVRRPLLDRRFLTRANQTGMFTDPRSYCIQISRLQLSFSNSDFNRLTTLRPVPSSFLLCQLARHILHFFSTALSQSSSTFQSFLQLNLLQNPPSPVSTVPFPALRSPSINLFLARKHLLPQTIVK